MEFFFLMPVVGATYSSIKYMYVSSEVCSMTTYVQSSIFLYS